MATTDNLNKPALLGTQGKPWYIFGDSIAMLLIDILTFPRKMNNFLYGYNLGITAYPKKWHNAGRALLSQSVGQI